MTDKAEAAEKSEEEQADEQREEDQRAAAVQYVIDRLGSDPEVAALEEKYGERFWEETPVKSPSTPSSRGDEKSPAQKAKDKALGKK